MYLNLKRNSKKSRIENMDNVTYVLFEWMRNIDEN